MPNGCGMGARSGRPVRRGEQGGKFFVDSGGWIRLDARCPQVKFTVMPVGAASSAVLGGAGGPLSSTPAQDSNSTMGATPNSAEPNTFPQSIFDAIQTSLTPAGASTFPQEFQTLVQVVAPIAPAQAFAWANYNSTCSKACGGGWANTTVECREATSTSGGAGGSGEGGTG